MARTPTPALISSLTHLSKDSRTSAPSMSVVKVVVKVWRLWALDSKKCRFYMFSRRIMRLKGACGRARFFSGRVWGGGVSEWGCE